LRASLVRGVAALAVCMAASVGTAHADTGDAALSSARASWDKADFRRAEPLFK